MKNKRMSAKLSLYAAALSAVVAVFFLIYGLVNAYFDIIILLADLAAAVLFWLYGTKEAGWSEYMGLGGVVLLSYSLGLFFLNSYTVWADWYGNFDMYGSRGGITPVIIQMVLLFAAILLGIISCFQDKGGKAA